MVGPNPTACRKPFQPPPARVTRKLAGKRIVPAASGKSRQRRTPCSTAKMVGKYNDPNSRSRRQINVNNQTSNNPFENIMKPARASPRHVRKLYPKWEPLLLPAFQSSATPVGINRWRPRVKRPEGERREIPTYIARSRKCRFYRFWQPDLLGRRAQHDSPGPSTTRSQRRRSRTVSLTEQASLAAFYSNSRPGRPAANSPTIPASRQKNLSSKLDRARSRNGWTPKSLLVEPRSPEKRRIRLQPTSGHRPQAN